MLWSIQLSASSAAGYEVAPSHASDSVEREADQLVRGEPEVEHDQRGRLE